MKKVNILLSAFNGEKYIEEQIRSILAQKDVKIHLIIRDDGSTDNTVKIIRSIQKENGNRIDLIEGENVGYRKSFYLLLCARDKNSDYYAFSDQDDVWMSEKLIVAIKKLECENEKWLYSSALILTDKNLRKISFRSQKNVRQTLKSFFIRTRLSGCTMVFKPELAEIAGNIQISSVENVSLPDHDAFLCMISLASGKKIIIDDHAYIFHRRLENSVTAGKKKKKRVLVEYNRIFKRKNSYTNAASMLLKKKDEIQINADNISFLKNVMWSNKNRKARVCLFFDKEFSSGIFGADALIRIKIMHRIY